MQVGPSTARASWRTSFPSWTQGAFALGPTPAVWTEPASAAVEHETVFHGLSPSTRYRLWLRAVDAWGRAVTSTVDIVTAPSASRTVASLGQETILLDGQPFFPLALWAECADSAFTKLAIGINLFLGNGCGPERDLVTALNGQAFSAVDSSSALLNAPGLIGWYYQDELDARIPGTISEPELGALTPPPPSGLLSFLTLTNHFYSRAEPLPTGRAFYPVLAARANVLGFDLYPLQNWCRTDGFDHVYDAQRELEHLADGKPTFQWIEVRMMDCVAAHLDPSPMTVRAETWLAIAGGADGIGYFPNTWSDDVGLEITRLNRRIKELAPALLAPKVDAGASHPYVKVGARTLGGAIYVVAVNSSRASLEASVRVPGLADRTVDVLDEGRRLTAAGDVITDRFDPLAVHVYVAPPPGWDQ